MSAATEKDLFTKIDECFFGTMAQHTIDKQVASRNPEEAAESGFLRINWSMLCQITQQSLQGRTGLGHGRAQDALRERFVRLGYWAGPAEKKELSEPTGPLLASNECMEVTVGRDAPELESFRNNCGFATY